MGDHIAWSYANLARAHAALTEGCAAYHQGHHIIRSRLFRGLQSGAMAMGALYDDERLKLTVPQACCYCGSSERISLDHLIPRMRGGSDVADNLVWACRSCNSSKGGRDMLEWMSKKEVFPPVLLLRRYIKLIARHCDTQGLLSRELAVAMQEDLPFDLSLLPYKFPALPTLKLWQYPVESQC
ncbi:HNH endonuclease [Candidatus Laterigemmans baculatus]|uniref:HNH endonuclease n=1 Tax=Candidatus Laterigemmans baculatus TaxID=2770505 RepID=UPI0013D92898|nr:HNH endonuclease [Candidatus Laterigemmans baculatus]